MPRSPSALRRPVRWLAVPVTAAVVLVTFALPGQAADDTEAPTAPGVPTGTIVGSTATLTWTPSVDNVGVTGYTVTYIVGNSDVVNRVTTATNSITVTAGPSYTVRGSLTAADAAGNVSPSVQFSVTLPPGDTQPPTVPGTPVASNLGTTEVTLTWARSTDNVHGTFGIQTYQILRVDGAAETVVANVPQPPVFPNSWRLTGLTPNTTYQFAVRARDYAGNVSARSAAVVVTTLGSTPNPIPPPLFCTATYRISSEWPGAFLAEVTVRNVSSSPINGWTVRWTFADGQRITNGWSANLIQDGPNVTGRNVSWNGQLAPNAATMFGFIATRGSVNSVPTVFCTSP